MVCSSRLLYLICYMLKKIDFQKILNVPSHSVEISILLKINGAQFQLQARAAKLELTVLSSGKRFRVYEV